MDWIANLLIVACWYWYPRRLAVAAGAVGSLIYAAIGVQMGWWGLVAIELLITALQARVCFRKEPDVVL
jgi:hypothetical protein